MPPRFFRSGEIYYGWVIVAVVFITLFLVLGFRFSFGVFYVAILDDTGWQRGETAAIFSTAMITYALTSLLSGALFDWFGPRVLFPAGALVLGVGLLLCGTIQRIWEFYLYYGVVVGVAFSMLGFIPHMAFVPRWFVKRRGLATAIALSGVGLGSLGMAVFSEKMIEWLGWRTTLWVIGVIAMVVLIPLTAIFHRKSPAAMGLFPDGLPGHPQGGNDGAPTGLNILAAFRHPAFWLLFLVVTMVGVGNMTLVVHQTRLLVDMGHSLTLAATLFGMTGLMRSVGGLIWGPLSDRIGRGPCIAMITLCGGIGISLLLYAQQTPNLWPVFGFVLFWGIGFYGMTPIYVTTVASHFQGKHLGKIIGFLDQGFGIGSAAGPFLAGLAFDRFGTYEPALWGLLGVVAISGLGLWAASSWPAAAD